MARLDPDLHSTLGPKIGRVAELEKKHATLGVSFRTVSQEDGSPVVLEMTREVLDHVIGVLEFVGELHQESDRVHVLN